MTPGCSNMRASDAAPGSPCPRCGIASGTVNLLTSMTRYYRCDHCACAWQVGRPDAYDLQRARRSDLETTRDS